MSKKHEPMIKTPRQLITVVALAFILPITLIVLLSQLVTGGEKGAKQSDVDVMARIQPVGEVKLADASTTKAADKPEAPAAAPVVAAAPVAQVAAAAAPAAAGKADGKKVYDTVCTICHGAGVAGAPKFGDKAAWAPRLKAGMDALYSNAIKGKAAMPAKGGNAALSDAEVKAAVDYMAAAAK